ncbi:coiled-coil domain-containing protein 111 [Trypanosoma rangeli]|uniref:DNA-directed primase/polymerase protein n=1 Tax=Trypanosoma rangeli TaxID=5698 RepID=A0A3R7MZJ4_TRYRA|nr:coiled-coil domain-containing protein 111 [Trypanosoma rangeli]RNF10463.1 coiled-coil domain-containing protein 111 [Trypanosoma rangeli]|eukprot:RNF10463.1 coiled-coil domain-containing protein 111 [Trypanosoma rangeli]
MCGRLRGEDRSSEIEFRDSCETAGAPMLWCRSTFVTHFSGDDCQIFPTQQKLFDFIDARGEEQREAHDAAPPAKWLPFGIEFPSEEEVTRELASRALRASTAAYPTPCGGGDAGGRLFRKRASRRSGGDARKTEDTAETSSAAKRRCRAVLREDYAVLYGATPLSSQTRMFLAVTVAGLTRVMREIEPLQQHLYELIREGSPCHLYFDVERERDYSAWRRVVNLVDADADAAAEWGVADSVMDECRGAAKYMAALSTAVWLPPRCCAWNCRLRADNGQTTTVLLAELRRFLCNAYPALIITPDLEKHRGCEGEDGRSRPPEEDNTAPPLGPGVEVMIMRSVNAGETEGGQAGKFSQHYVVKIEGQWFNSNADVGRLVGQFVDYLYERARTVPRVHVALFYHDAPKEFAVLPPAEPSQHLPFLPLRCVIDTAVYSRNRMLRCLGSCKLHKRSILAVERYVSANGSTGTGTTMVDAVALLDSLVTLQVGHRDVISILPTAAGTVGAVIPAEGRVCGGAGTELLRNVDITQYDALARHVAQEWSAVGGALCRVSSVRQRGERYLLLLLEGSRYCGNVRRQHLSNNVYVTVDLQQHVWAQKCFDPDCASYRSAPRVIPAAVLPTDRHDWTNETQTAALASHALLRTTFKPP